ncbi:stress responsive protein [Mycobacterium sp. E3298]|uniref:Dabb family protein n=1 Tax=unclassified Mycobacterium TaxID=2642494 RepID=UPI0008017539|nr:MULTISPECIES: Dabb family protein [unclassified Mycobacterium]OBG63899.1 stress responsive protein [Mycobacterium sp. E188]OBG75866.1 stress responsive protein [Mycobacterium sp. E3298]OBH36968.1 stress responsive protein [Mycobacterium sp. E183]
MYNVTRLLDVADEHRDRILTLVRASAEATGARHRLVEPTLPGARNGGDVLVHLRFDSPSQWLSAADDFTAILGDPAITHVNGVTYGGTPTPNGGGPGTVYRALLLRVLPDTDVDTVARFEDELTSMPRFIPTIRAWQLSRVDDAVGASRWTHVFEQEFSDVDALMGPYLMHPIHWAVVDRWFDPECPDVIIRDRVCHSFCRCDHPVLTTSPA